MANKHFRKAMDEALAANDIVDTVVAVGQFSPKGADSGSVVGGLIGGALGGLGGTAAAAIADAAGATVGRKVVGDMHHLPSDFLLGVSEEWVYGVTQAGRGTGPSRLLFQTSRAGLKVTSKTRVTVHILELEASGDPVAVRLEGSRVPTLGVKPVIDILTG